MRLFRLSSLGAALALSAALMLSACGGTGDKGGLDLGKVDTALSSDTAQNTFTITCGAITVVSGVWDNVVAANPGKISPRAQYYVDLAKTALVGSDGQTAICTPPYPTSVATLVPKVTGALANLYLAFSTQGLPPPKVSVSSTAAAATDAPPTGTATQ